MFENNKKLSTTKRAFKVMPLGVIRIPASGEGSRPTCRRPKVPTCGM